MGDPPPTPTPPGVLTDEEAAALVAEFATERVHAVALVGSYARGDADAFSDIDLKCFVPRGPKPADWFGYRFGRFLNVFSGPVEERLAALQDPGEALWAVPMFRDMRVLLDREGRAQALRRAALAFTWTSLELQADQHVSLTLAYQVEYALKVVGSLTTGAADRTVSATWELLGALTRAMAVHQRLLVPSDRGYFRMVRAAAGDATEWSRQHRLATGTVVAAPDRPPWEARGIAALRLYRETVARVRPILDPRHGAAVDGAVQRIDASDWGRPASAAGPPALGLNRRRPPERGSGISRFRPDPVATGNSGRGTRWWPRGRRRPLIGCGRDTGKSRP